MEAEHGRWAPGRGSAGQHGSAVGELAWAGDGVPDRADVHGDEVVELVAPVRGGGQAEPAPDRDLPDGILEGGGWHVVALVGDDKPVPDGESGSSVRAGGRAVTVLAAGPGTPARRRPGTRISAGIADR